jgi:TPR repeat protein
MTQQSNNLRGDRLWKEGSKAEDAGDIKKAVRLYRIAARLGNTSAQSNLGNLLDDYVVPRRPAEAIYWYKRAVRRGDYIAARNLAMHYRNKDSSRWYIYWLSVAAKMGDKESEKELRKVRASIMGR